MAKKRENKFLSFIVVIIIAVFVSVIYVVLNSGNLYQSTFKNQQSSSQTYKSKTLKFSVDVPSKFKVEEKFTTVSMKDPNGEIFIDRSGTNFKTLNDHLNNLSQLNHFTIVNQENITINTLPAVVGIIDGKKHYFIYGAPWTIYAIFTSSEALFNDLDKIAQSFKYTP